MTRYSAIVIAAICSMCIRASAQSTEPGVTPMNSSELRIALSKLRVTGTVMYVAAHPDDENTALLAYFAKGKKYRTVYLSLTRGEGGQNILGAEKGADLGIIRTQELLDARRVDGAEQMFSRAIDFGFSKSSVETITNWGEKETVGDIVWAIRKVRPDIIITRFSPTEGGHGNHTASAILAERAYALSGDSSAYPEQLTSVRPWKAKRLFFNRLSWGDAARIQHPGDWHIDVGEYNPLLGLSYTEIAGISRSMHKTQAMGSEQRRGKSDAAFVLTEVDSNAFRREGQHSVLAAAGRVNGSEEDLFAGIEPSWSRYPGGGEIDKLLAQAERNLDSEHPDRIIPLLLRVQKQLAALAGTRQYAVDPMITQKRNELTSVIATCLGLHARLLSAQARITDGEPLALTLELIGRAGVPMTIKSVRSTVLGIDTVLSKYIQPEVKQEVKLNTSVPSSMDPTRPYWLRASDAPKAAHVSTFRYSVPSQEYTGLPVNPDSLLAVCDMTILGEPLSLRLPVRSRVIDPVEGEIYKPVTVVPALDISFTEQLAVWTHPETKTIAVRVRANADIDSTDVRLTGLDEGNGFTFIPVSFSLPPMKKGDERTVSFSVSADTAHPLTVIAAEARTASGGHRFTMQSAEIAYPHIMTQQVMRDAQLLAVQAAIVTIKRKIGYIAGSGDDEAGILRQCGYDVEPIADDTLQKGSLAAFDAIVIGPRAYNVRSAVRMSNSRLLEYVRDGGTLIVQYQTPGKVVENIGPYPFRISSARVTDETAEMFGAYEGGPLPTIPHGPLAVERPSLRSDDSLGLGTYLRIMTYPNALTAKDFDGWVQERGLSFAAEWDGHYAAPFIASDPSEPPAQGSLIAARYGKGYYCYTGLALFRQLPAGVTGAFRLLSNLIELSQ